MIGTILGIVSLIFMVVALLPMLGWLNWAVIPLSAISLLISLLGNSRTGTVLSALALIVGVLRLKIGWGIL